MEVAVAHADLVTMDEDRRRGGEGTAASAGDRQRGGDRLLAIVRRSSGSVVTWSGRRWCLLSAQGMDVEQIAKVSFTSPDRVRDVINNFNQDGFDSLYPRYAGGRPPTFTLPQRQQVKKIALSRPVDHGLAFSTWSLTKLASFLMAEVVVDDISHEGLRDRSARKASRFR